MRVSPDGARRALCSGCAYSRMYSSPERAMRRARVVWAGRSVTATRRSARAGNAAWDSRRSARKSRSRVTTKRRSAPFMSTTSCSSRSDATSTSRARSASRTESRRSSMARSNRVKALPITRARTMPASTVRPVSPARTSTPLCSDHRRCSGLLPCLSDDHESEWPEGARGALAPAGALVSRWTSACTRSAPCQVERIHVLVKRLARYRLEPGGELSVHLAPLQRRDGLAHAARADLGGLLGDQRLHHILLELLDLKRAGVEADHPHIAPARVAQPVRRPLCREQVRSEDALQIGMASERPAHERGRRDRIIAVKTLADDVEPELVRRVTESLDAGVGGGDRAIAVDHIDQAGSGHELGQGLRGHLARAVVVRRDP